MKLRDRGDEAEAKAVSRRISVNFLFGDAARAFALSCRSPLLAQKPSALLLDLLAPFLRLALLARFAAGDRLPFRSHLKG
jgi:hypothetical protein